MRIFRFGAFLVVGLAGAAGYYFAAGKVESHTRYITAAVSEGKLREYVTASGSLQAVVTVEVGSELSGHISELLADFNDRVVKGQPIAKLDPKSYEARRAEARASLEIAKAGVAIKQAELERAQAGLEDTEANLAVLSARRDGALARYEAAVSEADRKESLAARKLITREELEAAQLNKRIASAALREAEAILAAHRLKVSVARADVARQKADLLIGRANVPQKQAQLEVANADLERTEIKAPIDGIVIKRNVSAGQTVAASLETPTLFTIAEDLSEMELHARVDETDIGSVRVAQPVEFSVDAYPDRVFSGKVSQIRLAPEIVQNVVTYTVVIRTHNSQMLLLPGMTARIRIHVMESQPVLRIPIAALDFRPQDLPGGNAPGSSDGEQVWVLGSDQSPRRIGVTTGLRDRSYAQVTAGNLSAGDKVITNAFAVDSARHLFGIRLGL